MGRGLLVPVRGGRSCCRESKAGRDLEETPRGTSYLLRMLPILHPGRCLAGKGDGAALLEMCQGVEE